MSPGETNQSKPRKRCIMIKLGELTHPPSLYRSSATASDGRSKSAEDKEKDQNSKVEGEKGNFPSAKMQITRVSDHLGLKALPPNESIHMTAEESSI